MVTGGPSPNNGAEPMPAASHVVMGDCALAPAANADAASNVTAITAWQLHHGRTDAIRDDDFNFDIFPPLPNQLCMRGRLIE
jgi:hypothetical protein